MVDNTNVYKIGFNKFLMASYRTSMQIIGDLLTATEYSGQEGIKTTALISKANLPHSRLSKFLSNLTGSGLINKIEFDGKRGKLFKSPLPNSELGQIVASISEKLKAAGSV